MAINVLVVGDGLYLDPTNDGINFTPGQDATDNTFTVSEFLWLLRNNPVTTISVDTAHRRADPNATFQNFNFTTSVNLSQYDVIWLFGYEGWNGGYDGTAITDAELLAITQFMNAGGGVFATGDHNGMGSYMCGKIPRVSSMRKWFGQAVDIPAGYPTNSLNYAGATVTSVNWPGLSVVPSGPGRADTLQKNPTDTTTDFQFDDQSDEFPQPLSFPGGSAHPILQGPNGPISRFPDHMHEGEVVTPLNPNQTLLIDGQSFAEYPTVAGYQPLPSVIATGNIVPGHVTDVEGSTCEQNNFTTDPTPTVANTIGIVCVYDGWGAGVGRVVTDSSFHHYLDLNLIGDPCGSSPDRTKGFGAGYTTPASGSVLADMQAFYVNTVMWLAGGRNFYFVVDKSSFGRDEVDDDLVYPNAFWLFLEGFTPNLVGSSKPNLSGAFKTSIPGITISLSSTTYDIGKTGANANAVQRIRFGYDIKFTGGTGTNNSLQAFPAPGAAPSFMALSATINIQGQTLSFNPLTDFELLGGDDPYFTNVNPAAGNAFYLSQDLRVFSGTAGPGSHPVNGAPNFGTDSVDGAYSYIQSVITYLNQKYGYLNTHYTPPTNSDPLDTILPNQMNALQGDSSVTPTVSVGGSSFNNYNFAIARVRLKGSSGAAAEAKNVKVFFRLFTTQTNDTDYINTSASGSVNDPYITYPSDPTSTPNDPSSPLPGTDSSGNVVTIPCFATANYDNTPSDYTGTVNNQTIEIPSGQSYVWAFFGCFINVYDKLNIIGGQDPQTWLAGGTHHCIVAQIAYSDSPIENENGVIESPNNCDKLAQRNLSITIPSGNPGFPVTHLVPQTFDLRPSPNTINQARGYLENYPDELMIDWGNTPVGSMASIYWPGANSGQVLQLASRLYPTNLLSAADAHTIQCKVTSGVTYIPIPPGANQNLAGLLTVELPATVRAGNEFDVLIRRITSRQLTKRAGNNIPVATRSLDVAGEQIFNWRYIVGTFLVRIPVQKEAAILPQDENLLAIFKWRLGLISLSNRWYPVLLRFIQYLSARINAMGGNASSILPVSGYYPLPKHEPGRGICDAKHGQTGKVSGLVYDRFGDFEGFCLYTEEGHERSFYSREREIEEIVYRAWLERFVVRIVVHASRPHEAISIVLLRAPR
jgi:hypothetical protein